MSREDEPPLRLAVVGHTNTGKTSLLRTLLRDADFGEVSGRPGTTRHVEGARLLADGDALVELYDTPGMEDAIALLDYVDALAPPQERLDGPARIARFLASPSAAGRFEQEAKVLRQLLASDAGLYVIDARDPVLPKHRDELALLAGCARPLLPVLNFVRQPDAREDPWREALARLGLHAVVAFDTVAPPIDGERLLYEKLGTLLDAQRARLHRLLRAREREAAARREGAARIAAELLLDVAALRVLVPAEPRSAMDEALSRTHETVRTAERAALQRLLALYHFRPGDVRAADLPLLDGRWEHDLFSHEALAQLGIRVSKGAAAGAAAGFGIDLLTGGLSLGAATAIGALLGGAWQTMDGLGPRLLARLKGGRELTVDDGVLRLLAARQQLLLQALEGRGHAAMTPIELGHPDVRRWREQPWPEPVAQARAHPEWSSLAPAAGHWRGDDARTAAIEALARVFLGTAG
jgi:hypothetical protein